MSANTSGKHSKDFCVMSFCPTAHVLSYYYVIALTAGIKMKTRIYHFRSYVYTACQSICDSLAEPARITKDVKNYLQIKLSKLSLLKKEYQKNKIVSSEFPIRK